MATRVFQSLSIRNYRLYAAGQAISVTGSWMQRTAQDWLVLDLSGHSGSALGIVTGLQFAPIALCTIWGGVVADRFPKQRVLLVTEVVFGLGALGLGVMALTRTAELWSVYSLALAIGIAGAIDGPARQVFVVELVGPEGRANAIGLTSATFNLARIVGPSLAGALIAGVGTGWVFVVNAMTSLVVIAGLMALRVEDLNLVPHAPKRRGQLWLGFAYVRTRPDLLAILGLMFFVGTFGLNFQVTSALMSTSVFRVSAASFGLAIMLFAVGSLVGALLAARRTTLTSKFLVAVAVCFGVLETGAGLAPSYWSFVLILVPTGLAATTLTTASKSTLQMATDPTLLGRVMSIYMLVAVGGTLVGAPLIGWVAEAFGPRWSVSVGGTVSLMAAVGAGLTLTRFERGSSGRAVEAAFPESAVGAGQQTAE